jgi:hypothetical protein
MGGVAGDVDHLEVGLQLAGSAGDVEAGDPFAQVDVGDQEADVGGFGLQNLEGRRVAVGDVDLKSPPFQRLPDDL